MWSPAHRLESGGAGRSPGTQRQNEVLGDDSGGETPVPIPNTAVKPASADGTALATGWESRSSPGISFFFARHLTSCYSAVYLLRCGYTTQWYGERPVAARAVAGGGARARRAGT